MPIRLHLGLLFLTNILFLLAGFMLGMSTHEALGLDLPAVLQDKFVRFILFGMLPAALGVLLAGVIFRFWIPGYAPSAVVVPFAMQVAMKKRHLAVRARCPSLIIASNAVMFIVLMCFQQIFSYNFPSTRSRI